MSRLRHPRLLVLALWGTGLIGSGELLADTFSTKLLAWPESFAPLAHEYLESTGGPSNRAYSSLYKKGTVAAKNLALSVFVGSNWQANWGEASNQVELVWLPRLGPRARRPCTNIIPLPKSAPDQAWIQDWFRQRPELGSPQTGLWVYTNTGAPLFKERQVLGPGQLTNLAGNLILQWPVKDAALQTLESLRDRLPPSAGVVISWAESNGWMSRGEILRTQLVIKMSNQGLTLNLKPDPAVALLVTLQSPQFQPFPNEVLGTKGVTGIRVSGRIQIQRAGRIRFSKSWSVPATGPNTTAATEAALGHFAGKTAGDWLPALVKEIVADLDGTP